MGIIIIAELLIISTKTLHLHCVYLYLLSPFISKINLFKADPLSQHRSGSVLPGISRAKFGGCQDPDGESSDKSISIPQACSPSQPLQSSGRILQPADSHDVKRCVPRIICSLSVPILTLDLPTTEKRRKEGRLESTKFQNFKFENVRVQ